MRAAVRRQLVNAALLAGAVLMALAVVLTSGKLTSSEQHARRHNLLAAFDEDALKRVTIERQGRRLVLVRDTSADAADAGWRLVEPVGEEPDPETVQNLLGSLEYATVVRRIPPEDVNRAAFGLDAPRAVLGLSFGRTSYRLVLGGQAPMPHGGAYVEVGGDGVAGTGVVVVRRELVEQIDVDLDELRGHQIVPYSATALRGLRLEGQGGTRKLRYDAGHWRFDGMRHGLLVERDGIERIAVQLTRAKAERFLEPRQAAQAQRRAQTVTVTEVHQDANQPKAVVVIGGTCPGLEASVVAVRKQPTPAAACIPASVLSALTTPAEPLVARSLFTLRLDEVERVVATLGERRLEFARQEEGFVMQAPRQAKVALEVGNQRLEAMLGLRGELVGVDANVERGTGGLRGKVTLYSAGDTRDGPSEQTVLLVAPTSGGRVRVRRAVDGAVLELDRESARVLEPDATLLRPLQVLDFSTRDVRQVEVTWQAGHQQLVRSEAGAITLAAPKGHAVDSAQAATLMDTLASLTAERWVADADDGTFGLDKPTAQCRVRLSGDAGAVEHELAVGGPAEGGYYARLSSDPGVFVLSRLAVQTLETWLLDRSVFVVRPDEPTRLVLETRRGRVELGRVGDRLVQQAGSPKLSVHRVERILEMLSGLRAEAAVHLGAPLREEGLNDPALVVLVDRPAGSLRPRRWRVGAGDSWHNISVYYARADGVDATYVIARSKVQEILDAF